MRGLLEAIQRRRSEKTNMDWDSDSDESTKEGALGNKNKKLLEAGLSPDIIEREEEADVEVEGYDSKEEKGPVDEPNELEALVQDTEQKVNMSKETDLETLEKIYDEDDLNAAGFKGKAARKMKEHMDKLKGKLKL